MRCALQCWRCGARRLRSRQQIRPLAEALSRWPDLFASLADRVRRLEAGQ
jgi:hypothetical protein